MPLILRGDARQLPLADGSVDLVVTSPPYFALRDYLDGGSSLRAQIGSESTPTEFLNGLLDCSREMARVLKASGSMFVNLGDKYSGAQGQTQTGVNGRRHMANTSATWRQTNPGRTGIPQKSLMGLPWRYAIRCVDELGLILRAEIIWAKPNGLPESVTDRVRRSHENWFHFTRRPRYFSAVDEIREPHARSWGGRPNGGHTYGSMKTPGEKDAHLPDATPNPLGRLPGSVWSIPTQPLTVPEGSV